MKQKMLVRQGDVMFIPINRLPDGPQKKRDNGTAAYGEVTGHSHRLSDLDAAEVLEIGDGLFVRVSESGGVSIPGATFIHEEHLPVTLEPGDYEIRIQREYQPEGVRSVLD